MDWAAVDADTCSIGKALGVAGDRWAWILLREVSFGVTRFDAIQAHTGASRRTMSERLRELCDAGLLERVAYKERGQRTRDEYRLTPAGRDLIPVLIALREWGDRHATEGSPPVVMQHAGCGRPVRLHLRCSAGHEVDLDALEVRARR